MQRCQTGARPRYWLTLLSGMLECLCFAGVIFGFASLMFVLKVEGYFAQLCSSIPGSNSSQDGTGEPGGGGSSCNNHGVMFLLSLAMQFYSFPPPLSFTDCSKQDEQFSLVFTLASFLNNFLCLLNGYLFDRFGTMATRLLAMWVHLLFLCLKSTTQMILWAMTSQHRKNRRGWRALQQKPSAVIRARDVRRPFCSLRLEVEDERIYR